MVTLNNGSNSTRIPYSHKIMPTRRMLVVAIIVILTATVTTGFVWIQTDQAIAPPSVRVLNWLWAVFVCRCPA